MKKRKIFKADSYFLADPSKIVGGVEMGKKIGSASEPSYNLIERVTVSQTLLQNNSIRIEYDIIVTTENETEV